MKKTYIRYLILIVAPLFFSFCSEEVKESLEKGGEAPGLVKNVKAINIPGGAEISYDLPSSQNLLYVEAIVETPQGKVFNYKASSYNTKITVLGLPSSNEQVVNIYSVSKSGVKSAPTVVKINPLEPPYITAFKSINPKEDFGGIRILFENETKADLAFFVGYFEDDGTFIDYDAYYTALEGGKYAYRGLPTEERKFGFYVRDRWDNFSDTIFATLTPLYEEMLEKELFKAMNLPGDGPFYDPNQQSNIRMNFLWDTYYSQDWSDPYISGNTHYRHFATNKNIIDEPASFTFDLGQVAQLSRVRINHYYRYINRGARKYEIWGHATTPPIDGSWDTWTKLGEIEQVKPSNLPGDTEQYGPGDAENWLSGDNFDFDTELPAVRYIRIKSLEDWRGFTDWAATEITFYGAPEK